MKERVVFTGRECRLLDGMGLTVRRFWFPTLTAASAASAIYDAATSFDAADFEALRRERT